MSLQRALALYLRAEKRGATASSRRRARQAYEAALAAWRGGQAQRAALPETRDRKLGLLGALATEAPATPEQVANMALTGAYLTRSENPVADAESARQFQLARRAMTMGRRGLRGRPYSHEFSRVDDFVLLVLHFQRLGWSDFVARARQYWERHGHHCPAPRHVARALNELRSWHIPEEVLAPAIANLRRRYRLNSALPRPRPRPSKSRLRFRG